MRQTTLIVLLISLIFATACGDDALRSINSVILTPDATELEVDETLGLDVSFDVEGHGVVAATPYRAIWSSSDERVASVDDRGVVTAVAVGTATITAAVTFDEGQDGFTAYQGEGTAEITVVAQGSGGDAGAGDAGAGDSGI